MFWSPARVPIPSRLDPRRNGRFPQPLPHADDYAMMFFTGGTTGLPKAPNTAIDTSWPSAGWRPSYYSTLEYDSEVSLSRSLRCSISLATITASIHPLYLGSTHVLVRRYKPEIVLEQLSDTR